MANWNSGYVYNAVGGDGGFFWNGADFVLLLRIHEVLRSSDEISLALAQLILEDKFDEFYEDLYGYALVGSEDVFHIQDSVSYAKLISIVENMGIKDAVSDLIVMSYLYDRMDVIDEIRLLATVLEMNDQFDLSEITSVNALINALDRFGMKDVIDGVQFVLMMFDKFGMTDGDPDTAISDFIIGVTDDYDNAYDWLLPFGLKVDWGNSTMQIMPEAELTTIEMPGIDGSIIEDTVYKDRLFNIVAYSEQGLTINQKEELKSKITRILDSTKHQTKRLTVQDRGVTFDSKYDGLADIVEGPSFVKATIPLRVAPYGDRTFAQTVRGSGLVDNSSGDCPLGVIMEITGPISNPSFTYGDKRFSWNGYIASGESLVINHSNMTCYIVNVNGKKVNALSKLSGGFYKVPSGSSAIIQAYGQTESHMKTEYSVKVLW